MVSEIGSLKDLKALILVPYRLSSDIATWDTIELEQQVEILGSLRSACPCIKSVRLTGRSTWAYHGDAYGWVRTVCQAVQEPF